MSQDVKRKECVTHHDACDCREAKHQAVVAELKAEVDHLNRQLADAMSGCCDCPMFKSQDKTVVKLKAENDILKSKASQFESTLKETMRVRDAEIERLKRANQIVPRDAELLALNGKFRDTIARQARVIEKLREQRDKCLEYVSFDVEIMDKELEAIEQQGEGT